MNLNEVIHHIGPLAPGVWPLPAPELQQYYQHYQLDVASAMPNVTQYIGTFESGPYDIVCQLFRREEATATVFVVHGYTDHLGLYGQLIRHLLGCGYTVVGFDLPGHGLSTGELASISSFSHYDRALEDCLRLCAGHVPEPWYALGQSTGAAAVMSLLLRDPGHPFSRAVLLSPLVRPAHWAWLRWVHLGVKRILPKIPRSFRVNSSDLAFLDFVASRDPLQARHLKTAWVTSMNRWIDWFLTLPPSALRVLVVQGEQDDTVDWRYNLPVVRQKFPLVEVVQLAAARHHLVAESRDIRQAVFDAIERFLGDPD